MGAATSDQRQDRLTRQLVYRDIRITMDQRVFKLSLSGGVQRIRLDPDSVDYDWKGSTDDFHGTLPYENLRLNARVKRRNKVHGKAAVVVGLLAIPLIPFALHSALRYLFVFGAVLFSNMIVHLIIQQRRGHTICVQIEPQPFGFSRELPIPDTKAGRDFLVELEAAWKASLRRRFLTGDIENSNHSYLINWLEHIGVLTKEEAAAERAFANHELGQQPNVIESAVN